MLLKLLRHHLSQKSATDTRIKINNPFKNKSLDQVDKESKAFAGLVGDPYSTEGLFWKAGRIAFNPHAWSQDVFSELTDCEKDALGSERQKGFLRQTKYTKLTVITLWLSSILQGWIQSTSNGANLTWYRQTGLEDPSNNATALWRQAGTNAAVFFVASAACYLSDILQSSLVGRRGILFIAAVICLGAAIGAACVHSWTQLLVCRLFLGIAMGLKGAITSVFAAEISSSHLRGAMVMGWQAGDTLGIWLGFTANLIVSHTTYGDSSWRWQTASVALPALCLIVLVWAIPDSPRLYLKRGKYPQAFQAMCLLRETPLQAARDLFYANAQLQVESDHLLGHLELSMEDSSRLNPALERYQARVKKLRWWNRIWALLANPRTRRALQSALVVMIAQQLCGFNVLAFYSNNFFSWNSPHDNAKLAATWLSWGIGLCNFVCTIPSFWLIDKWGRASLLMATYPGMIVFMLATSLTFVRAGDTVPKAAVEALVYFFTFFYSLGQGPVAFTYSAEVFPLVYREIGMSVVVAANMFGAGLLTLFVPQAQFAGESSWADKDPKDIMRFNRSQAKMLGAFVGLEVLAYLLIFFFVPETARCISTYGEDLNHMSLEELNCIFEQPTFYHARYRLQEALPNMGKQLRWGVCRAFTQKYPRPPSSIVVYRWRPDEASQVCEVPQPNGTSQPSEVPKPDEKGQDSASVAHIECTSPAQVNTERTNRDAQDIPYQRNADKIIEAPILLDSRQPDSQYLNPHDRLPSNEEDAAAAAAAAETVSSKNDVKESR